MPTAQNNVNTQFNISAQIDSRFAKLDDTLRDLNRSLVGIDQRFNKISRGASRTNTKLTRFDKVIQRVNLGVKAFVAFELSRLFSDLVFGIGNTISEAQRLEAQLISLTGGADQAARTFDSLSALSLDLPVRSAGELVTAFTKLENLNLNSNAIALRELADLSAGLGRGVPELVEAIADASTFEFERLKEQFGIVARSIGDEIQLTFQGTTVTIERSATAIQEFLGDIARNEFGGAAQRQLDTIGGAYGRFANVLGQTVVNIDEATGASDALATAFNAISQTLIDLQGFDAFETIESNIKDVNLQLAAAIEQQRELAQAGIRDDDTLFGLFSGNRQIRDNRREIVELTTELSRLQNQLEAAGRSTDSLETATAPGEALVAGVNNQVAALEKLIGRATQALPPLQQIDDILRKIQASPVEDRNSKVVQDLITRLNLLREQASTNEFQKDLKQTIRDAETFARQFGNSMEQAQRAYNDALADLDRSGFSRRVQELLGIDDAAIRQQLRDNFEQTLFDAVGPQVIIGVTDRSLAAIAAQKQKINEALLAAAGDPVLQQALRDRFNQSLLQDARFQIDELTREVRGATDPLFDFEQKYLENRQLFLQQFGEINAGTEAELARVQNLFTRDFLADFNNQALRDADDFVSTMNALNDVLTDLEGRNITVADELRQLFINNNLRGLIDDATFQELRNIAGASTGQTEASAQEEIIKRTNETILQDTTSLYERIAELRRDDLALQVTSERQRAFVAAAAASDILDIWSKNSRSLFELNKILDISILANDAAVAIGNAYKSFSSGPLGIFGGIISITAIVAKFAGLINEVRNREFGDSSISGGGSSSPTFARQAVLQNGGNSGGTVQFNIYGNVLDTNGAFRREVVETVKDAFGRDELTERDITQRRF